MANSETALDHVHVIRRITRDDVDVFRQTRLRALAESPSSFGSTYAAEVEFAEATWVERVTGAAEGDERAVFLAFDGKECIGLAGGTDDDLGADKQLISMWVAPSYRGTGVATELVDAVLAWAADSGAKRVGLWVTQGNDRAKRLYEKAGFKVTGDVQPLPSDPCKDEVRMVCEVSADLRQLLRDRLTAAMKRRDPVAMRALRSTLAAIDNAEAPPLDAVDLAGVAIERSPRGAGAREVARSPLTADETRALVRREVAERLEAADDYARSGETTRAEELRTEALVLSEAVEGLP